MVPALPSQMQPPPLGITVERNRKATSIIPQKPPFPITPVMLCKVWDIIKIPPTTPDKLMIWAAMNVCFFSFLPAGEVCMPSATSYDPTWHLCLREVSVNSHTSPTKALINSKASKTDSFRQGVTITQGKTDQQLCQLTALLPFIALCNTQPGPLFQFRDDSFLTIEKFM